MTKKVLIYGGRGALGSTMVSHFQSCGWWVCSVDLVASDTADASVIVDPKADWLAQGSNRFYSLSHNSRVFMQPILLILFDL